MAAKFWERGLGKRGYPGVGRGSQARETIEVWSAGRTDAEILASNIENQKRKEIAEAEREKLRCRS